MRANQCAVALVAGICTVMVSTAVFAQDPPWRHEIRRLDVPGAPDKQIVVEFDDQLRAISLEEKPKSPRSDYAIPGLYFYDNDVVGIAAERRPSDRGEYEMADVNRPYLEQGRLSVDILPRGNAWLDTGTFESLLDAGNYVRTAEEREGLKIGVPEEVAWRLGVITDNELQERAELLVKSGYGGYLLDVLDRPP